MKYNVSFIKGGKYGPDNYDYYVEYKLKRHNSKRIDQNTNDNKCTLGEIFLSEILKSFSVFIPDAGL